MKPTSLYVHIPFCHHICAYCDFAKVYYHAKWADNYLEVLQKELADRQANRPFETVFIGGGSPSALNEKQLENQRLSGQTESLSHQFEAVQSKLIEYIELSKESQAKIDQLSMKLQSED